MPKLPVLKPREVVALLEARGFVEIRQRGAHKQLRHPDGRGTTVPFHKGRDISPVLLRKIARDVGLTAEALLGVAPQAQPEPEGEEPTTEGT
jgi:predicted RNA binding protein YcfA (HicA-like mRNA interferase family)